MKKLIGMTAFVLEQSKKSNGNVLEYYYYITIAYANFLKQPLSLWQFVPCDEEGNVLEEPLAYGKYYNSSGVMAGSDILLCEQYQQAKQRCLFEKVNKIQAEIIMSSSLVIEGIVHFDLILTPTALKQLGL